MNAQGATGLTTSTAGFALDARALDALKHGARDASPEARKQSVREAATQFEAVFMNMLMKSMRDAGQKDGALESDTTRTYTGMFDQQLAQKISQRGIGLADMIVKQLERRTVDPQSLGATPRRDAAATLSQLRSATAAATAAATEGAPAPGAAAREFVRARWNDAQAAALQTGVPPQFILGQAALESGWGRRDIKMADGSTSHNLFGIKATGGWKGATVEATTTEYVGGVARKVVEKFRAYGSHAESFADHARLLTANPRYAASLKSGADAAKFAQSLQQAGYATDPLYASKLTGAIRQTLRAVA